MSEVPLYNLHLVYTYSMGSPDAGSASHTVRAQFRMDLSPTFISPIVFDKLFCKSQFPQNFVNLFFMLVMIKDDFTDLWGS
jgi:hypothetical protein